MQALIDRWQATKAELDRSRAEKIALGLFKLAEVANHPGFVARGIAEDGISHHFIGSDDQTAPWFYGLWKYWQSELCTPERRDRIVQLLIAAAERIVQLHWHMPCDHER